MNGMTKHLFRLTALAAAVMAMGTAQADEVTDLTTPESSVSVNAGVWSGDRHQMGIYDGQREGKEYGSVDLNVTKQDKDSGTWIKLNGNKLGSDTQEFGAKWERQGDMGVTFDYSKTPRANPYTFNTGLQGIGSSNETVSGTNGGKVAFAKRDVTLETIRESYELGFSKLFTNQWDIKLNVKTEEKTGTRQWGMGGQPYFVVEPIDSTTNQLDAAVNYRAEKLQLSIGYYGSQYQNHNNQVIVTNNGAAISAAGGNPANPQPLSLPLDNQAHQLYLKGAYAFTNDTKGNFKLSYSTATQNEDLPVASNLIPFGSTTAGTRGNVSSLDGRVDTILAEASLKSRVTPKLTLTGNLRYYDVNDRTPLVGVIGTTATGVATVWNTPTSYKTQSGKFEAVYRLPYAFSLVGGVDYKKTDRSVPEVGTIYVAYRDSTDEVNYRLQLRKSMSETVNGSIAYVHSDRGGSPFIMTTAATAGVDFNYVNAGSPLHLADRHRDKVRGMLDWTPLEALSLQFVIEKSKDNYDLRSWNSAVSAPYQAQGLTDGDASLYAVDASYILNDKWKANAWYSYENTSARRLNYSSSAGAQKDTTLEETSQSLGLGVRGDLSSKWQVGANADWVYTVSSYNQYVGAAGTRQPLDDIKDRLTRLGAFATYSPLKNHAIRISYLHEIWRTNDWTYQFANGNAFMYGTGTTDGTSVLSQPNQSNDFLGIRYTYKF